MNDHTLDITPLKKALQAYNNALMYIQNMELKHETETYFYEFEMSRASLIQHFEFCYELSWKFMKRYIEMDGGNSGEIVSRKDLFRVSKEMRLISDFQAWVKYTRDRNRTSHLYDEDTANEVFQTAKEFVQEFSTFVETIGKRV